MEDLHERLYAVLRAAGWQGLSDVQRLAREPIAAGKHVLVVAPTGHGKTEAALIPVLERLLVERDRLGARGKAWPLGFKALYVTPLRALNRDLMARLSDWAQALGLSIGVRHGDTKTSERARQARQPPDLLITTPETLQLLFYGDRLRSHLATVRFVIVDEIHELAGSERGAQLAVALERLEEVVGEPPAARAAPASKRETPSRPCARVGGGFQRIGLSATVANPDVMATWLVGSEGAPRPVHVAQLRALRRLDLSVVLPEVEKEDTGLAAQWSIPPEAVAQLRQVRDLVTAHRRVLAFHNTRDGAELLASRNALWGGVSMGLHHGSLAPEHRERVEREFKNGGLHALVATSSLELGIDVGALDHVVQIGSPRMVARLVQRVGRSGHRVDLVPSGTLVAYDAEDALECAAVAEAAQAMQLEPLRIRPAPLGVVANQLVALANEYAFVSKDWAYAVMRRAHVFVDLADETFDAVWRQLVEFGTVREHPGRPALVRSGRARKHFLAHVSVLADDAAWRVMDESTKRSIGSVDEAFVLAGIAVGAHLVMAGTSWRVIALEEETRRIRVAPGKDLGSVPQWAGTQLPVSGRVAHAACRLRRAILENDVPAGHPVENVLSAVRAPLSRHQQAGLAVPTDSVVTLDVAGRTVVAGVGLGTRGNETLGRLTQALLSQHLGAHVAMESDAYRIHFTFPERVEADRVVQVWGNLTEGGLDLLLAMVLRDGPLMRYHLVHVAKQFGGLHDDARPDRMTRGRLAALLESPVLEEETLSRLVHDRFDVKAVEDFLAKLARGEVELVTQGQGPVTYLARDRLRHVAPRSDEVLLAAVRARIEACDALLVCVQCGNSWQSVVALLPRRLHCRRCSSVEIAVGRPWNEEWPKTARAKRLTPEAAKLKERLRRNAGTVMGFGSVAARCLVARGVGPDTAARILAKTQNPEDPAFWREILQAELTFARTNAFWRAK